MPLQNALIEEASLQSHLRANMGQNRHHKRCSEWVLAAQEGTNYLEGLVMVAAVMPRVVLQSWSLHRVVLQL
jgi:hypothetical protein